MELPSQRRLTSPEAPLAWFRPSIRRAVRNAWLQACGFVGGGALLLGVLRSHDVDFGSPFLPLWLVGIALVTAGPVWLTTRLGRVLGREEVLSVDTSGVRWLEGEAVAVRWAWDEIAAVEVRPSDPPGATPSLVISRPDGSEWRLPRELEPEAPEEAARLILELRQKAQLGLRVRPRGVS
jgi:hypothetical protein